MKLLSFSVVGAGGFAFFAVSQFVKIPGARLVGVFDEIESNSIKFKVIDPDIIVYESLTQLCSDPKVDLVYIATPPFLHYPQSREALLAGKHVICEKPAAIVLAHAVELRQLATERGLLFVVNLMQRYNFLYDVVKEIIDQKILGEFLHGFFENYASDEYLPANHWFWNQEKSGGIFIEHGVHFFDLFHGWLGEGQILSAHKINRKGFDHVWDRSHATVLYPGGLVNFYHAFDQPKIMDRQEMRLQFEKGEITLFEWVPTRLKMTALCTDDDLQFFKTKFTDASIQMLESADNSKTVRGRFKEISFSHKITLDSGDAVQKEHMYQLLLRSMFQDQLDWIRDRSHIRKVTDENAINSLKLAQAAESKAQMIKT